MTNKHSLTYSKLWISYYIILLVLMFISMRPNTMLPMYFRIAMLGLTFIPTFFKSDLLPFVFLCFYGISSSSFTPILPTEAYYYLIIVLFIYIPYRKKSIFCVKALMIFSYYFLCSLLHFDTTHTFSWILIVILLSDMVKKEKDIEMLFYGFIIISTFLSLLYLVHRESYLVQYNRSSLDLERSGWINSNIFGAVIASGGLLSISYVTGHLKIKKNIYLIFACSIIFILSFLALSFNSSRGSLAAFVIPSILLIFTSKLKFWIKVLITISSIFLFIIMLNNNVFDLIVHRLQEDTFETGGGRTIIWQTKINSFINNSNIMDLLFGIGRNDTNAIGVNISTHNDIVTSFIGFGIIGLILFVYFIIIYPIKIAGKNMRVYICILSIYTIIEINVLEPIFREYIVFIMFYFFIIKYCYIQKTNTHYHEEKDTICFTNI